jgi:hypothetical protein
VESTTVRFEAHRRADFKADELAPRQLSAARNPVWHADEADQWQTDASTRAMLPPAMPAVSASLNPVRRSACINVGKSRSPR